jgi:alpha-tubulin suppressor-like RCC1 family protein
MPLGSFRLNTLSRAVSEIIQLISQTFSSGSNSEEALGLPSIIGTSISVINISDLSNLAQTFQKISSGDNHSLAITTTGELYSWGSNAFGKTGLSITAGSTTTATQIGSATNWLQVSAGNSHSLAITTNGELWAWGLNTSGQLGRGNTTSPQTSPTRIGSATNWASVSAGTNYSLAVTTNGELWGWGLNTNGQLGDGTTTQRTSPTRIGSATNWASVSAGNGHSLAVTTNGQLWAWGLNTSGQLGRGNTTSPQTSPTRIGSATNWASVSAGTSYSLAVTTNGQLWAWGLNTSGQLGSGNTATLTSTTRIGSATNWASVSAGNGHSLAVTTNGQLWAWGLNTSGQLGRGNTTSPQTSPVQIGSATNWASVSAGTSYSLAVTTNGQLWASGLNTSGQLGMPFQTLEFLLLEDLNFAKISTGDNHSLAITTTGELYSWGSNDFGKTGLGTLTGNTSVPTRVGIATNWASVSAGRQHSLAVTTNGQLWAWGSNESGKTGLGTSAGNTLVPTRVGSGTNWVSVSAATNHSLAVDTIGQVFAWGSNLSGQLGRGNTTGTLTSPSRVGSATNWAQASAGINFSVSTGHSLAVTTTGELWAWGNNNNGQLGDGTTTLRSSPTRIGSATNWEYVSTTETHSLAITTTGELWAWGDNGFGRTGLGLTTGRTLVPTQVGTDTNWASVSASLSHSLAVTTTGELWAWGTNLNGRTGLGLSVGNTLVPTRVGTDTNWVEISAGKIHSLARKQ